MRNETERAGGGKEDPLCKKYPGHTMCKPKVGPKCIESENGRGFTKAEQKEMIKLNNKLRRKIALGKVKGWPKAADMRQLKWSDELAVVAQRHADQCTFAHDKFKQRQLPSWPKVGQNLWFGSSSKKGHPKKIPVKKAVDMWYEEIKLYKAKPPKYSSDHATGHFSQLIWGETEEVGCGYSYYKEPSGKMWDQLITCDYARAGNRKKHDLYKVGDPCSGCPDGTKCQDGLCA